MKITRRLLVLLSVLVLVAAACSNSETDDTSTTQATTTTEAPEGSGSDTTTTEPPPDEEPVTIRYFTFTANPDHLGTLDATIAAFEAENPDIKVDVETASFADYFTLLQTQIAGNDAPDAFELNFENFVSYATRDTLADLEPFISADQDFDSGVYYERAYDAFSVDGIQYGLPENYSTVVLYYNKDLFDQAGVEYPTDDWTWADERAAAEKLTAASDNVWGFFAGIHYWEFYKAAAQNGCSFFDDGLVTVNEAGCVNALQFMIDYVNDGFQPTPEEMSGIPDEEMFKRGELAMDTNGIWQFANFTDAPFKWDIVVEPGNTRGGSHFFTEGVAVSATSDKQEAAFRWLVFLTSSDEAARIRIEAGWSLPTLTDASLFDAFLDIELPANREAVLASLENVVVPPVIERQAEMQDAVNGLIERALAGEMTVQEALDQAKVEIEALLD